MYVFAEMSGADQPFEDQDPCFEDGDDDRVAHPEAQDGALADLKQEDHDDEDPRAIEGYRAALLNALATDTALRVVIGDDYRRRLVSRWLFHTPGYRADDPPLQDLRRLFFLETPQEDTWAAFIKEGPLDDWGGRRGRRLADLIRSELGLRLPASSSSSWPVDGAITEVLKNISRLRFGRGVLAPAVDVRVQMCARVWRHLLGIALFDSQAHVDERGKIWHPLKPECQHRLGELGVPEETIRRLLTRCGGLVVMAELVDLSRQPVDWQQPAERLWVVALAANPPSTVGITLNEEIAPPAAPDDDELERQRLRDEVLQEVRRRVPEVREQLTALALSIQLQVEARSERWGNLLRALHPHDGMRAERMGAIGEDPGSPRTQAALTRARQMRDEGLVMAGYARARPLEPDERGLRLGSRHVLPPCLDSAFPTQSEKLAELRGLEHLIASTMATLPADLALAFEELDPLLREAYELRAEVRKRLNRPSVEVLWEKGLLDEPKNTPPQLWRLEPGGRHRERAAPLTHAAQSGRVILAPIDVACVWPINVSVLRSDGAELHEYLEAMLLDDDAIGEWRFFLGGGVGIDA